MSDELYQFNSEAAHDLCKCLEDIKQLKADLSHNITGITASIDQLHKDLEYYQETTNTIISDIGMRIKDLNKENNTRINETNQLHTQFTALHTQFTALREKVIKLQSFNGNENGNGTSLKRESTLKQNPKEEKKTISQSNQRDNDSPLLNSSSGIYIPKNKNKEWFK